MRASLNERIKQTERNLRIAQDGWAIHNNRRTDPGLKSSLQARIADLQASLRELKKARDGGGDSRRDD